MLETLAAIAPLFILLGVGMLAGLSRRFRATEAGLNAFVFYFSLPAFLFIATLTAPLSEGVPWPFVVVTVGVTSVMFFLMYVPASLRNRTASTTRPAGGGAAAKVPVSPGPFGVASTFGNVAYLGIPIAISVVGPSVALGAALGQLFHNVLFLVGYPILKIVEDRRGFAPDGTRAGYLSLLWNVAKRSVLLNPVTLSVAAGLLLNVANVAPPAPVETAVQLLGNAAVPTAMFAVGLSIKHTFAGIRSRGVPLGAVFAASTVKLAILPLATLGAALAFGSQLASHWIAAAVIMAAMPVSSAGNILVFEYDGDTRLIAAATLVTSTAAILTIPAIIVLLP